MIRTYSELITFPTLEERFEYLRLDGTVGEDTFGFDRYLNQLFYKSNEWKAVRREVMIRDAGLYDYVQDLGVPGNDIRGRVLVHHMNPISIDDIINKTDFLLNPEYLICTIDNTHRAIHYGDKSLLVTAPIERTKYDTCPWRR